VPLSAGLVEFAEIDGVPVHKIDQYYALTPMYTFSVRIGAILLNSAAPGV